MKGGIYVEWTWPYALAALGALLWYFGLNAVFPRKIDPLMGAACNISAVLVGFMGAALAVILTISNSSVYNTLKRAGYTSVFFRYVLESIVFAISLLIISTIGFFLPDESPPAILFTVLWVLIALLAVFLYIRALMIIFKLLPKA